MSGAIPMWHRPSYQATDRRVAVAIFAFSEQPLTSGVPLVAARYGIPSAVAMSSVHVRGRSPSKDKLDDWRHGAFREVAEMQLSDLGPLDAARHEFGITVDTPDRADLGYLQGSWAAAKWLVDRGCSVVFDLHAARWYDRATIGAWPGDRPFDFDTEASVIIETGGTDNMVHTRGMIKFARPDVLVRAGALSSGFARRVVHDVAEMMAAGYVHPRNTVFRIDGVPRFRLVRYEPDVNAPQVNLNNDGLLLVPDE